MSLTLRVTMILPGDEKMTKQGGVLDKIAGYLALSLGILAGHKAR